jgi:uncharacterized protein YjbI with pentapeptide repeats
MRCAAGLVAGMIGLSIAGGEPACAQTGMMSHVDLTSPKMSEAELSRADVIAMLEAATPDQPADLSNKGLNGLDLSNLDLSGADLSRSRLNRVNLKGTLLRGARLDLAWLIEANLEGADLRDVSMIQTQLIKARLAGADLSNARIVANFEGANLADAKLTNASMAPDMRNQSMGLMRTVFRSAVLDRADLSGTDLAWADMEFAKLRGSVLVDVDFKLARLGGVDMTGADVRGMNVAGANLASAMLLQLIGEDEIEGVDQAINLKRAFRDR